MGSGPILGSLFTGSEGKRYKPVGAKQMGLSKPMSQRAQVLHAINES